MKTFILCCVLFAPTGAFATDAGQKVADAGQATPVVLASVAVTLSSGAVVVEVSDAGDAGAPDAGFVLTAAPSLDHPLQSAKSFYTAVKTGNGWLVAMFMLFFVVGFIRILGKWLHAMIPDDTKNRFLRPLEAFLRWIFDTKVGGWTLNWLSAVGGCLSTAALAGMEVDAAAWKVAILASTGGTTLIELKDDVMEWWNARIAKLEAERQAKAAVVAPANPPPVIVPPPPADPPKS